MDLNWRRLRKNLSKRSRTSSSLPPVLEWKDNTKDTPPKSVPTDSESDEVFPRDSDLPSPSQIEITDNYERENDKDKEVEGGDILV